MFKQKSIAALVSLALSPALFAAQNPVQTEEVVVTATRMATPVSKVLSDVTVITREEIEETAVTSLTDLLARQPAVMLTHNGGAGTQTSLMIRGAASNQTIILVDGVRIVSATSNTTALQHIPVSQIERIEILRGPASSLYGADGIGGVIQIFTRKGGDGAPQLNASAGVGNHGTFKASAGVAGKAGDTRYSLQVSHDQTDGFSATRPSNKYNFNPDRDGNRNDSASLNVAHELAKGQELGIQIYQTWANTQFDYETDNSFDDRAKARLAAQTLYSRNQITDNWQSLLRYARSQDRSANHYRGLNYDNNLVEVQDSLFKTTQDEWLWQNNISTNIGQFVAGTSHTSQEVDSTQTFARTKRQVNAVFGSYQGEFGASLLQASLRHDNDSQFDGKTTGQVGYGYRFAEGWLARASYGTAFKAPTFNDLYWPDSGSGFRGNPDLKPENARNTEVELAYAQGGSSASLTAFHNRIEDLISSGKVNGRSTKVNINEAKIDGVTLEGATTMAGFDLSGSATYLDARDAKTDKQLTYRARQSASLSVSRLFGQLNVGVEQQLVGKRYSDAANKSALHGYGLTNVFADYAMNKDWSVFGRVNNVFDRDYESVKDYNASGVDAFIGVRYQPK